MASDREASAADSERTVGTFNKASEVNAETKSSVSNVPPGTDSVSVNYSVWCRLSTIASFRKLSKNLLVSN